jgi:hypothetical protein
MSNNGFSCLYKIRLSRRLHKINNKLQCNLKKAHDYSYEAKKRKTQKQTEKRHQEVL